MSSSSGTAPTVGIITALPEEYAAVQKMMDNGQDAFPRRQRVRPHYYIGEMPAGSGETHTVVLAMAVAMGNSVAGIWVSNLTRDYPTVETVIMVGIAGGVPNPEKPEDHVRLGDVVVSGQAGVVQYDFVKEEVARIIARYSSHRPSARYLQAVKRLEAEGLTNQKTWVDEISRAESLVGAARPDDGSDILYRFERSSSGVLTKTRVEHPHDPRRVAGQPRVFVGPIASANTLQKNPFRRDELREQFGVRAVEMEGSGIEDATWIAEVGYMIVRGICDYCDPAKNDIWHGYAAVVAAAYARALLKLLPSADAGSDGISTPAKLPPSEEPAEGDEGVARVGSTELATPSESEAGSSANGVSRASAAPAVGDGNAPPTAGERADIPFSEIKRQRLEKHKADLIEEYEATNAQLAGELSSANRLRLKRQLDQLEAEINELEPQIGQIDGQAAQKSSDSLSSTNADLPQGKLTQQSSRLRNRLWNQLIRFYWDKAPDLRTDVSLEQIPLLIQRLWDEHLGYNIDALSGSGSVAVRKIREYFFADQETQAYELVRFILDSDPDQENRQEFLESCYSVITQEDETESQSCEKIKSILEEAITKTPAAPNLILHATREGGISTGLFLRIGQRVSVFASGEVSIDRGQTWMRPDGMVIKGPHVGQQCLEPDTYWGRTGDRGAIGALTGWIGRDRNTAFLVGYHCTVQAGVHGFLHFGVNDTREMYWDNEDQDGNPTFFTISVELDPNQYQAFEPEMILIPAGQFLMGSEPADDVPEQYRHDQHVPHFVDLPAYYIAKTPVTNIQYLEFVRATGYQQPSHWQDTRPPTGKEDHPVVNVSWRDAMAYCDWLSQVTSRCYCLPTEAEWEKAARGPDKRVYPWGNEWDASRCNAAESAKGDTTHLADYPSGASPYGLLDMAGNVTEWTISPWGPDQTVFDPEFYNPTRVPKGSQADDNICRVMRGGSFVDRRYAVRCASRRNRDFPQRSFGHVGFRVAHARTDIVRDTAQLHTRQPIVSIEAGIEAAEKPSQDSRQQTSTQHSSVPLAKATYRILVDEYHGDKLFTGRHWRQLKGCGFEVITTEQAYTPDQLSDCDVLVIWFVRYYGGSRPQFSKAELAMIRDYLHKGGSAFLIGLGWGWAEYDDQPRIERYPLNLIADDYGVFFTEAKIDRTGGVHFEDAPISFRRPFMQEHPVTDGVNVIVSPQSAPGSLMVTPPAISLIWGSDDTEDSDGVKNPVILAASERGKTRIVCLQHCGYVTHFRYDNSTLLKNILTWLVIK